MASARKREELINESNDIQSLVDEKFKSWRRNREVIISCLRDIAKDLHSMQKHANRSKLSGSILGIFGSVATIAGFLLAPATAGVSLGLTVGGIVVGAAGGITSLGALLAEFGITKSRCDEATKKIEEDNKRTSELKYYVGQFENVQKKLNTMCEEQYNELTSIAKILPGSAGVCVGLKDACLGVKAAMAVKSEVDMAKTAMKLNKVSDLVLQFKNIKQLFRGAGNLTVVLGPVAIVLDIWSIVTESKKIHKGSKSQSGEKLERIANTLEDEIIKFEKALNSNYELSTASINLIKSSMSTED